LRQKNRHEVPVSEIGERILERLRELDEVAYVRYASVYKDFNDVSRFIEELQNLSSYRSDES
jgi:transcriptional repressor NrdR